MKTITGDVQWSGGSIPAIGSQVKVRDYSRPLPRVKTIIVGSYRVLEGWIGLIERGEDTETSTIYFGVDLVI